MSTSISKTMSDQSTIIILSDKESSSSSSSPSSGSESRTCFGAFFLSIGFLFTITIILFGVMGWYFYSHNKSTTNPPTLEGDDTIETERVLEDERTPFSPDGTDDSNPKPNQESF